MGKAPPCGGAFFAPVSQSGKWDSGRPQVGGYVGQMASEQRRHPRPGAGSRSGAGDQERDGGRTGPKRWGSVGRRGAGKLRPRDEDGGVGQSTNRRGTGGPSSGDRTVDGPRPGSARTGNGGDRSPGRQVRQERTERMAGEVAESDHGTTRPPPIDEWVRVDEVRTEATDAIERSRSRRPERRHSRQMQAEADPGEDLSKLVGSDRARRLDRRLRGAAKAFDEERFADARQTLRPIAREAPSAAAVRELLGLTYYRLGQWKPASRELEAFVDLTGSVEQHPVLADCYRAMGRHRRVQELWDELKEASPSGALVAEGRIVVAGSLADRGRLSQAISLLEKVKGPKRPQEHHLRVSYALADLYERSGDVARARDLFQLLAGVDGGFADARHRARALG